MSISDEAVEAAHKAWRAQAGTEGTIFEYNLRAALEAAAPHMQPSAATVEELDALPEGVMVRTDARFYLKEALRHGISTWVTTNEQHYFKSEDIPLPATVIYTPYRSQT